MALNSSGFTLISGLAYFENPHMSPGLSADSYFFDITMCTCALEDENLYVKCSLCINSTTDCTPMACNIYMINAKVNTERNFQRLTFHFTFINVNFSRLPPSAEHAPPKPDVWKATICVHRRLQDSEDSRIHMHTACFPYNVLRSRRCILSHRVYYNCITLMQ
jgi:hypothetical protein